MPKGDVLLSYPMEATLDEKPIWLWGYHHRKLNDLVDYECIGREADGKRNSEDIGKADDRTDFGRWRANSSVLS